MDDDQSFTSTKDSTTELCQCIPDDSRDDDSSDDDTIMDNFDKKYLHSTSYDSIPSLTNTTSNTNDNMRKPADDNYDWIVTDTNNRSPLDQGSGSAVMSDKSLIHDHINCSLAASLPTFQRIGKMPHEPYGQGNM